jgi:hypothetical protein
VPTSPVGQLAGGVEPGAIVIETVLAVELAWSVIVML